MKKNLIIYLAIFGLFGLFSGCEKDGTKVVMLENPIAPTLKTIPDLTLLRTKGTETLLFVGTPVDPGFTASASYTLEACATGNEFVNAVTILSGVQDAEMKITVSALNGILLKSFPADVVSSVDFRIHCVLVVDAGTGAKPLVYNSATKTASVTLYGLPRLDLIGSGIDQKIESALGDGNYSGYVKLDNSKPFTLKDPDANVSYGDNAGALGVGGAAISVADNGWYLLTVDVNGLKYEKAAYMIGLVGSATPNQWNSPDSKMDYNADKGFWYITIDLTDAQIKFRLNDGWNTNWGGKGTGDGTPDNYSDATTVPLAAGGKNIGLLGGAGNYTIHLYIAEAKATIVKN